MPHRIIQLAVIITLFSCSAHAQTQSDCRTSYPTPANVKPGVGGSFTFTRDGKTLLVPGIDGKIVFVRDGARDSHIFMIKALKDWKRGATAGLLDAPGITLEAEAEFRLLLVPVYWTFFCSSKSEPA